LRGLTPETSEIIAVARVICIIFMMTVHVWPGAGRVLSADVEAPLSFFYLIVVDSLGRASVPLLSYFSGILFVLAFTRTFNIFQTISSKAKILIWPMAFWSIPMIFAAGAENYLRTGDAAFSSEPGYYLTALLGIGGPPANAPLHFLREIFVMCCYWAVFLSIARLSRWGAFAAFLLFAWLELRHGEFLISRDFAFTFFSAGAVLALLGRANYVPTFPLVITLLAANFAIVTSVGEATPVDSYKFAAMAHIERAAMAILIFFVAATICQHAVAIKNLISRLEPAIFTIFCSHDITISLFGAIAFFSGLHETDKIYPLFFLFQLVACILIGILLMRLLRWIPYVTGGSRSRMTDAPVPA
jgi:hypothetical protein